MYTLFYSPGACSMAAHIALEELGLTYDLELVSIATRETLGAKYLKINPKGRVPALMIEGEKRLLTELPAILTYLSLKYPDAPVGIPSDPLLAARCQEWLGWLACWVHGNGFSMMMLPDRFTDDKSHYEPLKAKGREIITDAFKEIERLLNGSAFAVDGQYTMADLYLFVMFRWAVVFGVDMRAGYPTWASLVDRIKQRPAVQRVIAKESEVRLKTHGHPLVF